MIPNALPQSLLDTPRLDRWVAFQPDGTVVVRTGKLEIGQGAVTALLQIAAEELDIPAGRVSIVSGASDAVPDERYTAGSMSIEMSGSALRLVCAEVRALFLAEQARRLGCAAAELSVDEGVFRRGGASVGDYWALAAAVPLARDATGTAPAKPVAAHRLVGTSLPRLDLPAKLFGAAFLQDQVWPGMLHARVLRQPAPGARLAALDTAPPGGPVERLRIADFVALLSPDEWAVERAAQAAAAGAVWTGAPALTPAMQEAAWLRGRPSQDRQLGAPGAPATGPVLRATYSRPYQAHAALGPSCAVALFQDGRLEVWAHGQGVFPLRHALSRAVRMAPEAIVVRHAQGPGCYGHNGTDDVALDAALIARARPGTPIRVQWRREEEFGFEPCTSAILIDLAVELDAAGRPADWTAEIWSGTHRARSGPPNGHPLLAEAALPDPPPLPMPEDVPETLGGGAVRNAEPLYDVPRHRILHHLVPETPVRTSSMRGLGAVANVFAMEGMVDELAARAGADPLAYRLAILSDPRGRAVLARVADMAGWARRGAGGDGRGLGLGFARYKNRAAYAAVIVELEVAEDIRLLRVWCAADPGLVINPDGARNQLEGGIVHAASMTLKEQVMLDTAGISSLDWDGYPILRCAEAPEIEVALIGDPAHPPLGLGEAALGPTAGAIGNAVAHALGLRVRHLPLTRARLLQAAAEAD